MSPSTATIPGHADNQVISAPKNEETVQHAAKRHHQTADLVEYTKIQDSINFVIELSEEHLPKYRPRGNYIPIAEVPANFDLRETAIWNKAAKYFEGCTARIKAMKDAMSVLFAEIADNPRSAVRIIAKTAPSLIELMKFIETDLTLMPMVAKDFEESQRSLSRLIGCLNDFKSKFLTQENKISPKARFDRISHYVENLAYNTFRAEYYLHSTFSYDIRDDVICCISKNTFDGKHVMMDLPLKTLLLMTKPKGVLFDVDDCLLDSETAQKNGWKHSALQHGLLNGLPPELADKASKIIEKAFEEKDMKNIMENIYDFYLENRALPMAFDAEGNNLNRFMKKEEFDDYLVALRREYLKNAVNDGTVKLLPGARELLVALYKRGIAVGICTSSPISISEAWLQQLLDKEAEIQGDGLGFDVLILRAHRTYGNEVEYRKPHPEIWELGSNRVKDINGNSIPLDEFIGIDDNPKAIASLAKVKQKDGKLNLRIKGVVGLAHCPEDLPEYLKWLDTDDIDPGVVRVVIGGLKNIRVAA